MLRPTSVKRVNAHHNILAERNEMMLTAIYRKGGYIAGGYARYLCMGNPKPEYGDIDIFVQTFDAFYEVCGILEMYGLGVGYDTVNAKTFQYGLQVIKPTEEPNRRRYGIAAEVVSKFDFTGIACWYEVHDDTVNWVDYGHYMDSCAKMVRILQERPALETWVRMMKYAKKGWNAHISVMNHIAENWDKTAYLMVSNRTDDDLTHQYSSGA